MQKLHSGSKTETRKNQVVLMQQGLASLSSVGPFRQSQFLPHKVQLSHNKIIYNTIKYMKRTLVEERAQNVMAHFWVAAACLALVAPCQLQEMVSSPGKAEISIKC
jgi:hypothetical protein